MYILISYNSEDGQRMLGKFKSHKKAYERILEDMKRFELIADGMPNMEFYPFRNSVVYSGSDCSWCFNNDGVSFSEDYFEASYNIFEL